MAAQKKPATRIQRQGNGHSYFLDGEKVPGVTTVLGNGIPKPALVGWAANKTAEFVIEHLDVDDDGNVSAQRLVDALRSWNSSRPQWAQVKNLDAHGLPRLGLEKVLANVRYKDVDEASNKGSEVHGFAERLARGETVTPPEYIRGHVEAYVRFLDEWGPRNAILERVVVNRDWSYMGKFDLWAEFPGKVWASGPWEGQPVGPGLLDVKTSRSGIFPEVGLQLAGYAGAEVMLSADGLTEEPMPPTAWVGAIHVRSDGYDVIPFNIDPGNPEDPAFLTFLYAKQVGDALDWKNGWAAECRQDIASIVEAES